jgi:hypothetical protein
MLGPKNGALEPARAGNVLSLAEIRPVRRCPCGVVIVLIAAAALFAMAYILLPEDVYVLRWQTPEQSKARAEFDAHMHAIRDDIASSWTETDYVKVPPIPDHARRLLDDGDRRPFPAAALVGGGLFIAMLYCCVVPFVRPSRKHRP